MSNQNTGILSAKGIVKKYKNKEVLKNIDLELERGKIYGLIGRNGAGKTTLLSVLTAQNPLNSGNVTMDGEEVWENQKVLDKMCFSREFSATANGNSVNEMKVKEYLKIASIFYANWDQKLAETLIEKFELDITKKIGKLSDGMRSMVTIVVAMASKAEFTFMDEPVAGIDVVMRETFYKLLLDEYAETGRTFVISTHIIEEAANIFEEVIILNRGEVLVKENTQDLLDRTYHISGNADEVDKATAGLKQHHVENMGRSKAVTVFLEKGKEFVANCDVSVQKVNLQSAFVALCGTEEM